MSERSDQYIVKMGDTGKSAATFTRPDNTTAYTALDVVASTVNLEFAAVMQKPGNMFKVTGATLEIDQAAVTSGITTFLLHLYDAAPTVIADNAAFDLPAGDRAKYLGNITLAAPTDLGATIWSQNAIDFTGKLASGSTALYGILQTTGGWTPAAEVVFNLTMYTAAP